MKFVFREPSVLLCGKKGFKIFLIYFMFIFSAALDVSGKIGNLYYKS